MLFFKKKSPGPEIIDIVFATKSAKWKALAELAKQDSTTTFAAWFEESREALQQYFDEHNVEAEVVAHRIMHPATGRLVFIEHYPLAAKEKDLFSTLPGPVTVYSSLDEALFLAFGGERISDLLSKMGMDENEAISHSMITRSIYKAQEKLAAKVMVDQPAQSMNEWMQKNIAR